MTPKMNKNLLFATLAVLSAAFYPLTSAQSSSTRDRVYQIIKPTQKKQTNQKSGFEDLQAIGPDAFPFLAELAEMHDSLISKYYSDLWQNLPDSAKQVAPSPINRNQIRQEAMHAIAELGPMAARPFAKVVLECLSDESPQVQGEALVAASWLIPDSTEALQTVSERFKEHPQNPVYLNPLTLDHIEMIWSNTKEDDLSVSKWYEDPSVGYYAGIATRFMGTNAIPYISDTLKLLNSSDHSSEVSQFSGPTPDISTHTKAMALKALGSIGHVTPEVADTLVRYWNDEDEWIRQNAAEAVALLGRKMSPKVNELIKDFDESNNAVLGAKFSALGSMGSDAAEAIPVLLRYASTEFLKNKVSEPENKVISQSIDELRISAEMALCSIDPSLCTKYASDWPDKVIGRWWWEAVDYMCELKGISSPLVKAVEPMLNAERGLKQRIAAFLILHHNPSHEAAKRLLNEVKNHGSLDERIVAARFLYLAIGDLEGVEELIEEGLNSSEPHVGQSAIGLAEILNPPLLLAADKIVKASWHHKDRSVRVRSGMLIIERNIELLPEVNLD